MRETRPGGSRPLGEEIGSPAWMRTFVLQDEDGRTKACTPSPPGWTIRGVGPEHSWLHQTGRAHYEAISDAEAMDAFQLLSRTEGIVPAIESAHALAGALKLGPV